MNAKILWPDLLIALPTVLLLSLGSIVIYSQDPKFAVQQVIFAVLGLVVFWAISLFNFEIESPLIKLLYFINLGLLAITFIIGFETRGSLRWLQIGPLQLQPSELAKPVLILFLSRFWANHTASWKNIIISLLFVLPFAVLIFKQPDLGTALTIVAIWLSLLLAANVSLLKLASLSLISLCLAPLAWFSLKDYQKSRILSFLSPENDPLGTGYNVIQSTIAVGSGQIFGRGLGRGTQTRLRFLPEFRTDFIFASIAEELGFLASFSVLVLYSILVIRIFKIVRSVSGKFGILVLYGVLGMFFFQITVNIGMNIGVVPVTGITLPLLSYGGSSLLSTMISLGLVASIARYNIKRNTFIDS